MAGMTVEDLLRQVCPAGTEMVAGRVGSDREVTWPTTLRTRPPAFQHIKGGEIALVSIEAMKLLDPRMQLTTVVRSLAGLSVAAVAVLGEIRREARDLADSVGLPLLALPPSTHLADLEQAIARAIVDHRTQVHQRSQEIYRRLTELAIEGRGVEAILDMLADLTGKDVVLEDQAFVVRNCVTHDATGCSPALVAQLRDEAERVSSWLLRTPLSASEPPVLRLPVDQEWARVVAPIAVRDTVLGFLSVVGRRGGLGELDDLAASRGASACAIELARERAVLEAEDRLQTDLVESLVTGSFASADAVAMRAERLGFDLRGPFSALVFGLPEPTGAASRGARPTGLARRLRTALEREVESRAMRAPIGTRGDRVVLLAPPPGEAVKALADQLRAALSAELAEPLSAGVGRPHPGVEGIRQSYGEADGALTLGARLLGPGQVAQFAELGLYRLLLALRSTTELETFYQDTLGTLADYDRKNDGELVKTLDAYFACLGSPTEAAERLHVHRNTLLYRLHRIQDIAAIDLSDAETRLALHLSLRIGEVLRAGSLGPAV
jgi:PucR family transcriptional regulator, purine catabolism regulatory protein